MSELAVAAQSGSSPVTTMLRRTVVVVDMVGYSDVARMLEQNISALSVADLNRQIQSFITRSLDRLPNQQAFCVVSRPGDGIILLFENANDAHDFAYHVHLFAAEHNNERSEATAERWFRIGIATGDVSATACADRPFEFAGTAIANAVRLESAAKPGQIVVDKSTCGCLTPERKLLYSSEEIVHGKRKEILLACRHSVISQSKLVLPNPRHPITRRWLFGSSAAILTGTALTAWLQVSQFGHMMNPLPRKRFVALIGWPPTPDLTTKPILLNMIDTVASELSRAEAYDSDLFITTQNSTSGLTTLAQLSEIMTSLGANLILATSLVRAGEKFRVALNVFDSPIQPPVRSREFFEDAYRQQSLHEQAVKEAAAILDIRQYHFDEKRFKTGTVNPEAYAMLEAAEALIKIPNDEGLEQAIDKYLQAVNLDINFSKAYARLALAYYRMYAVRLDAAALTLARVNSETALRLDSTNIDGHLALASVLSRDGDLAGAKKEFEAALSFDPSNPRTLIDQARFYARRNQWNTAEESFNRLLKIRPNLWLAHIELGVVFGQQGKYSKALTQFRIAAVARPSAALSFSDIGWILLQQGNLSEAMDALRHSLKLKESAEAYATLAETLRASGLYDEAINNALKSITITSADPQNWLELGDSYASSVNHSAQARDAYARALKSQQDQLDTEPGYGPGWMVIALCSVLLKKSDKARLLIDKAESLAADDMDSQLYKVRILEILGNRSEALSTIERCLKRGATRSQFQFMSNLDGLRTDSRYNSIFGSTF